MELLEKLQHRQQKPTPGVKRKEMNELSTCYQVEGSKQVPLALLTHGRETDLRGVWPIGLTWNFTSERESFGL